MIAHRLRLAIFVVMIFAATGSAVTVFMMKKKAEKTAFRLGEVNREISAENQRISELRAEWSALDHPARLQILVERHARHLRLKPVSAEQIASIADVVEAAARRARTLAQAEDAVE